MINKLLLYLQTKDHQLTVNCLSYLFDDVEHSSISSENFIKNPAIKEARERMFAGIQMKNRDVAIIALNQLREFYKKHGENPGLTSSGYYQILQVLDIIGQHIIVIGRKENGWDYFEG